jgi:hypothetical protein
MTTLRRRLLQPHALAWVLALALLLALAQFAAGQHRLAHALADGANPAKQAAHLATCDLCLAAAAVGSAATAPEVALPPMPPLRHAAPQAERPALRLAPPARHYLIRAPPNAPD